MQQAVSRKLGTVDWDFSDSARRNGLHGVHPYPAKFIREIPRTLIRLFHPGDESWVLDPFCGSGTTLVEAALANIPAMGIDLHPLATLMASVKTTPTDPTSLTSAGSRVVREAKRRVKVGAFSIPEIPRLDHWFQKNVQEALAALRAEIDAEIVKDVRNALMVSFSSIIVRVSNQESDTRYAAIIKNVKTEQVWGAFTSAVSSLSGGLEELHPTLFQKPAPVRLLTKDILSTTVADVGEEIGLVVTSPPYPNAYEYWLYHKYRMYWLGMDPIAVRNDEIGARPNYFRKNPETEHDFERQMGQCFSLLARVMRHRAYACFIVGRSILHGREINNEELLTRAAAIHGFVRVGSTGRKIAANRKSFNPAHSTINQERVVIFSLEEKSR